MFRIGKNPQNDLVLKDRIAEDFHCILTVTEQGKIQVDDLKSKYGTFVNGQRVSRHILEKDDELQIGFTRVEWQKLLPALLELGSTGDVSFPSDEQIQELVETNDSTQLPIDTSLYQRDATTELVEEAGKQLAQPELDYPHEPIPPGVVPTTLTTRKLVELDFDDDSSPENPDKRFKIVVVGAGSSSDETDISSNPPESVQVPAVSGSTIQKKSDNQLYYRILLAVLVVWMTFMLWATFA